MANSFLNCPFILMRFCTKPYTQLSEMIHFSCDVQTGFVSSKQALCRTQLSEMIHFCSKSTYIIPDNNISGEVSTYQWDKIWKINTLPKIQILLWFCCHRKIACNDVLNRHIIFSNSCPVYFSTPETIEHILRECEYAKDFWSLVNPDVLSNVGMPLDTWILHHAHGKNSQRGGQVPLSVIFPFACWALWNNI